MENTPSRASKVLKILDSISSESRNHLISSSNKARWLESIEKPSDVHEDVDEFIELEHLELEEPDEQPINESDDENEPNPPKEIIYFVQSKQKHILSSNDNFSVELFARLIIEFS